MKNSNRIIAALAILCMASVSAYSETIHQTVQGEAAYAPGGDSGSAFTKGLIDVKDVPDAEGGKVGRLKSTAGKWSYISYWFGIAAPAGKSIIRFRIYVDGTDTAGLAVYSQVKSGQNMLAQLVIPSDAKPGTFVNVDVPCAATEDLSGVTIKKTDTSARPGPWIDSVSVVLP